MIDCDKVKSGDFFWYSIPGTLVVVEVKVNFDSGDEFKDTNLVSIEPVGDIELIFLESRTRSVFKKQLFEEKIEAEVYGVIRFGEILKILDNDDVRFNYFELQKIFDTKFTEMESNHSDIIYKILNIFDFSLMM